jgi:hypothetical protein
MVPRHRVLSELLSDKRVVTAQDVRVECSIINERNTPCNRYRRPSFAVTRTAI